MAICAALRNCQLHRDLNSPKCQRPFPYKSSRDRHSNHGGKPRGGGVHHAKADKTGKKCGKQLPKKHLRDKQTINIRFADLSGAALQPSRNLKDCSSGDYKLFLHNYNHSLSHLLLLPRVSGITLLFLCKFTFFIVWCFASYLG